MALWVQSSHNRSEIVSTKEKKHTWAWKFVAISFPNPFYRGVLARCSRIDFLTSSLLAKFAALSALICVFPGSQLKWFWTNIKYEQHLHFKFFSTCAVFIAPKRLFPIAKMRQILGISVLLLVKAPCLIAWIFLVAEPVTACPVGPGAHIWGGHLWSNASGSRNSCYQLLNSHSILCSFQWK